MPHHSEPASPSNGTFFVHIHHQCCFLPQTCCTHTPLVFSSVIFLSKPTLSFQLQRLKCTQPPHHHSVPNYHQNPPPNACQTPLLGRLLAPGTCHISNSLPDFLNLASILPRRAWFSSPPRFEATFDYTFSLDPSIQSAGSVDASTCFFLTLPSPPLCLPFGTFPSSPDSCLCLKAFPVRSCSNLQPNLSSSKCLSILDSTGNSTQYSVMIYLGTESKKERIYEYA